MKSKNFKGALLLTGGITIGIILTMISLHSAERSKAHQTAQTEHKTLVAAKEPAPAHQQSMQSPPGAAEAAQAPHAAAPAPTGWLTPQDVAAQEAAQKGATTDGTTPPAVPQYRSSNQTFYVYSTPNSSGIAMPPTDLSTTNGYPVQLGSGPMATDYPVGENGLIQNPCVDPPSVTNGRAYRRPMQ